MTETQYKFLTSYLGECWHELDGEIEDDGVYRTGCVHCGADSHDAVNRTFTTPQDMHDVFVELVDEGKFYDFRLFVYNSELFNQDKPLDSTSWLFYSPERFCWLVSEWMMKEGK